MGQGFTVNTESLAIRIGELNSVVSAAESAAGLLSSLGGDLGPGNINSVVQKVAGQWQDGLREMTDKIDSMAEHVRNAVTNYDQLEFASENRFIAKVDQDIEAAEQQRLREAAETARAIENARHIPEGKK